MDTPVAPRSRAAAGGHDRNELGPSTRCGPAPLITIAVIHRKTGIGIVGVGEVRASMPCFTAALEALSEAQIPA